MEITQLQALINQCSELAAKSNFMATSILKNLKHNALKKIALEQQEENILNEIKMLSDLRINHFQKQCKANTNIFNYDQTILQQKILNLKWQIIQLKSSAKCDRQLIKNTSTASKEIKKLQNELSLLKMQVSKTINHHKKICQFNKKVLKNIDLSDEKIKNIFVQQKRIQQYNQMCDNYQIDEQKYERLVKVKQNLTAEAESSLNKQKEIIEGKFSQIGECQQNINKYNGELISLKKMIWEQRFIIEQIQSQLSFNDEIVLENKTEMVKIKAIPISDQKQQFNQLEQSSNLTNSNIIRQFQFFQKQKQLIHKPDVQIKQHQKQIIYGVLKKQKINQIQNFKQNIRHSQQFQSQKNIIPFKSKIKFPKFPSLPEILPSEVKINSFIISGSDVQRLENNKRIRTRSTQIKRAIKDQSAQTLNEIAVQTKSLSEFHRNSNKHQGYKNPIQVHPLYTDQQSQIVSRYLKIRADNQKKQFYKKLPDRKQFQKKKKIEIIKMKSKAFNRRKIVNKQKGNPFQQQESCREEDKEEEIKSESVNIN